MAAVLLIPFLSLRFGVLSMLDSSALRRAAHFPPFRGSEKPAYWLYQLSSAALLLGPFFASSILRPPPSSGAERPSTHSACSFSCSPSSASRPPRRAACATRASTASPAIPCMSPIFSSFWAASSSRSRYRFWPPSSSFSSPPTPSSGPRSAGAARPSARPTSATAARSDATYKQQRRRTGCPPPLLFFICPLLAGVPR